MRLADPQGDATGELIAAIGDRAVGDFVARGLLVGRLADDDFANFHPSSTEVGERAVRDVVLLAAFAELKPVAADVRDLAILDRAKSDARGGDRAWYADGRLVETGARRIGIETPFGPFLCSSLQPGQWSREIPFHVRKTKAPQCQTLDEFAAGWVARQVHHLL